MAAYDKLITFDKNTPSTCKLTSFYEPEDGFVWSNGLWCEIALPVPATPPAKAADTGKIPLDIAIDLAVFKTSPELEGQNVLFYANGLRLASRFVTHRVTIMLELPAAFIREDENIITIDTPNAAFPTTYGFNDTRQLGIQLFSLRLTRG
jgi:hypothetical protein